MSESELNKDFFAPYEPAEISTLKSMASRMMAYGLSPEDVFAMAEEAFEALKPKEEPKGQYPFPIGPSQPGRKSKLCPECGAELLITPVNVSKCTNIGGSWNSSMLCKNVDCRYTELSEKTTKELR